MITVYKGTEVRETIQSGDGKRTYEIHAIDSGGRVFCSVKTMLGMRHYTVRTIDAKSIRKALDQSYGIIERLDARIVERGVQDVEAELPNDV